MARIDGGVIPPQAIDAYDTSDRSTEDGLVATKRRLVDSLLTKSLSQGEKVEWNDWARQVVAQGSPHELSFIKIEAGTVLHHVFDASDLTFPGPVDFTDVSFGGGSTFERCAFGGDVKFGSSSALQDDDRAETSSTFQVASSFKHAKFLGIADFSYCVWTPQSDFSQALFEKEAVFNGATFNRSCRFDNVKFHGSVGFKGANFSWSGHASNEVSFVDASVSGSIDFGGSIFRGSPTTPVKIDFREAQISGDAVFQNCEFGQPLEDGRSRAVDLQLGSGVFQGAIDFSGSSFYSRFSALNSGTFAGPIRMVDANFFRAYSISNAKITASGGIAIDGNDAKFHDSVTIERLIAFGLCKFEGTQFTGKVELTGNELQSAATGALVASFEGAVFSGGLVVDGLTASQNLTPGRLSLKGVEISESGATIANGEYACRLDFRDMRCEGPIDFSNQNFKDTSFNGCRFARRVEFNECKFGEDVDFGNVEFVGPASVADSEFHGEFRFQKSVCESPIEFNGVKWSGNANFNETNFLRPITFRDSTCAGLLSMRDCGQDVQLRIVEMRLSQIPELAHTSFDDYGHAAGWTWSSDLKSAVNSSMVAGRQTLANRLRILAKFAAKDTNSAYERLLIETSAAVYRDKEQSLLVRFARAGTVGHDGKRVGRSIALFLLQAALLFPALYMVLHLQATNPRLPLTIETFSIAASSNCSQGQGIVAASAVYISVRATLFAIPDTEDRSQRAAECLLGDRSDWLATSWWSIVPVLQSILAAILTFAIGYSVRRRLTNSSD